MSASLFFRLFDSFVLDIWWTCARKELSSLVVVLLFRSVVMDMMWNWPFDLILMTLEPTHKILALFVLGKFILQIRMRSYPVELDV